MVLKGDQDEVNVYWIEGIFLSTFSFISLVFLDEINIIFKSNKCIIFQNRAQFWNYKIC